ncbi:unnamed protein product [Moneuplotes crassus]|uniref:Uncharacterized protein n=1 Tax=Euplotes crassus TaxID=5936 RepID=A0AAD1U8Z5_EUPCR|nr:unnamed protein product [Moneuplotes crassus]
MSFGFWTKFSQNLVQSKAPGNMTIDSLTRLKRRLKSEFCPKCKILDFSLKNDKENPIYTLFAGVYYY